MIVCCHFWFVLVLCFVIVVGPCVSHNHLHSSGGHGEREEDGGASLHHHHHHHNREGGLGTAHEAILGSKKMLEEFERLATEDAKKKLMNIVSLMDKNKDGSVDKEELTNWVIKSFSVMNKEESEERFGEADANQDGVVTWKEYVADMYGMSNSADFDENQDFGADEKMISEDKEVFQASDLDHSGNLDKTEYESFSHPEEFEHTLEILFHRTMHEKDIDKDGYLDFQEFIGSDGKEHDKEWLISEKDRFENDFDKDHDGKMGREEILLWLSPNNRESAEEEAQHLIESCDDNLDQVLGTKEIIDHHDVFVGSEITDYGHHLENAHKFRDEL